MAKDAQNDTMQHSSKFATFYAFCNIRSSLQHLNFFATLGRSCNIYDFLQQSNDYMKIWALDPDYGKSAQRFLLHFQRFRTTFSGIACNRKYSMI